MNTLKKISAIGAGWMLALICLGSFSLMFWASRTDSAIVDELAHIPAGYGYVHNFDYRLNPEHPPLVKALAALPVLFLNPAFPTQTDAWQNQVNAQWAMGYEFLYASGNDANTIIETARIVPILITILTIILIYFFARRMMGRIWAILPAFLFAFDPTVLAHGHYVTTDVGAACGVLLALFFFLRFVEAPTTRNLWLAGIAFGIAQLTKFSTPLLVPLFVFLFLAQWVREMARKWNESMGHRFKKFMRSGLRDLWHLVAIGLIGYLAIVYPVYFLFTFHYPVAKQVADTTAILASFAHGPTAVGQACRGLRCLADLDIRMAGNAALRPLAEYLLGVLMVLQRSDGGNTIYFLGQVVGSGGPIYFPLLYLLKEPIPTLIIVFFALLLALWWMTKKIIYHGKSIKRNLRGIIEYLDTSFAEFSLASFIVLYWGYSMQSPLNIGVRHIIPTLPLIAILAAGVWKKWVIKFNFSAMTINSMASFAAAAMRSFAVRIAKYLLLILLLAWLFVESLIAAPYFLSYFNEFGGGTMNGYHWVTDSNYDWGQDLLRLQTFVGRHPEIDRIAVDYFGGGSPAYALGAKEIDWSSSKGNPVAGNIHWLAVSVNMLEGETQPLGPGQSRAPQDTYGWLTALRPSRAGMGNVPLPDYRIGTSIFVYHL